MSSRQIIPLLSVVDEAALRANAVLARKEYERKQMRDVAENQMQLLLSCPGLTLDILKARIEDSLLENNGLFAEITLSEFRHWHLYYHSCQVYGYSPETVGIMSLWKSLEDKEAVGLKSTKVYGNGKEFYLHDLFKKSNILPVIAASIGKNFWVYLKRGDLYSEIDGYVPLEWNQDVSQKVSLARLYEYKLVAKFYPNGLSAHLRSIQERALAQYA